MVTFPGTIDWNGSLDLDLVLKRNSSGFLLSPTSSQSDAANNIDDRVLRMPLHFRLAVLAFLRTITIGKGFVVHASEENG